MTRTILTCAIILIITQLKSQSWEFLTPADGEHVRISNLSNDKYYLYRHTSILTCNSNGEILANSSRERRGFREALFGNDLYIFEIPNDSIYVSKLSPDGNVTPITGIEYPLRPRPSTVGIVSEDLFVCLNFSFTQDTDDIIVFNSDGVVLNSLRLDYEN